MASLVHMPPWVHGELVRLVFKFFWKHKRDLVLRSVVVQAPSVGGFSVVDVKLKVQSLLVQWVKRFVLTSSSWSALMLFWFHSVFNSTPVDVFSRPFAFSPRSLPPFYQSLLLAWRSVDGSFSKSWSALVMASTDPHQFALAASMSAKSAYLYLLSAHFVPPHCEEKFLPLYGTLYWPTTWRQLHFCPLDRPVIDLAWQVAHGVLYTADRLISFGYAYDPNLIVFVVPLRLLLICSLSVPWLRVSLAGFNLSCLVLLTSVLLCCVVMFSLVFLPPNFAWFLGSLPIY